VLIMARPFALAGKPAPSSQSMTDMALLHARRRRSITDRRAPVS